MCSDIDRYFYENPQRRKPFNSQTFIKEFTFLTVRPIITADAIMFWDISFHSYELNCLWSGLDLSICRCFLSLRSIKLPVGPRKLDDLSLHRKEPMLCTCDKILLSVLEMEKLFIVLFLGHLDSVSKKRRIVCSSQTYNEFLRSHPNATSGNLLLLSILGLLLSINC